jgi:hypothetical protein
LLIDAIKETIALRTSAIETAVDDDLTEYETVFTARSVAALT